MEYSHPHSAFQSRSFGLSERTSALRKIFVNDPGIAFQLILCPTIFAGGFIFHLSILQWILVIAVTMLCLMAGICRTASILQINRDPEIPDFHKNRIKAMGTMMVTLTAFISLVTYLLVFVPVIIPLL